MKIKQQHKCVMALVIAAIASSTQAAPHEQGGYIGANIGTPYASVHLFDIKVAGFGSVGFNVNGGYLFNRHFALETGYVNYGFGLNHADVAAKFILPFNINNNDFTVFAKAGPALIFNNSGGSYAGLFAGVGTSYAMTDKLDLNLQAEGSTFGWLSLGLISTGLTYHFD